MLSADLYDARFKGGTSGFPSSPVWYESVVAVPTFQGTQVSEIKFYPIELGQKAPRSQRGTPRMADEAPGRTNHRAADPPVGGPRHDHSLRERRRDLAPGDQSTDAREAVSAY